MWIVFLGLMIIWFVVCTVVVVRNAGKALREANTDTVYHISCEKCSNERDASYAEVMKHKMTKTVAVKGSVTMAGAGVGATHVKKIARKCECPVCNKKTWHEIKDYNQHAMDNTKVVVPALIRYFASLLVGGIGIIIVSKMVSFFAGLF